jgi:hypothetical protein
LRLSRSGRHGWLSDRRPGRRRPGSRCGGTGSRLRRLLRRRGLGVADRGQLRGRADRRGRRGSHRSSRAGLSRRGRLRRPRMRGRMRAAEGRPDDHLLHGWRAVADGPGNGRRQLYRARMKEHDERSSAQAERHYHQCRSTSKPKHRPNHRAGLRVAEPCNPPPPLRRSFADKRPFLPSHTLIYESKQRYKNAVRTATPVWGRVPQFPGNCEPPFQSCRRGLEGRHSAK